MADVFISYHEASAGEIVPKIAAALENVGVSCWYAERDLTYPGAFAATITNEIRTCKVFLLVLNEGSNQSAHVESEVALAFQRIADHEAIAMKCFRVDDCALSSHLAYYLAGIQRTNGNPPDQKRMQNLAEEIAGILRGLPTWKMIHEREQRIHEMKRLLQEEQTHTHRLEEEKAELTQNLARTLMHTQESTQEIQSLRCSLIKERAYTQKLGQQISALKQALTQEQAQTYAFKRKLGQKQMQIRQLQDLQEQAQQLANELTQGQEWLQEFELTPEVNWKQNIRRRKINSPVSPRFTRGRWCQKIVQIVQPIVSDIISVIILMLLATIVLTLPAFFLSYLL